MAGNRSEKKAARYLQNVFDVAYTTALRAVRSLHRDAWAFSKATGEGYLPVLERMATKLLAPPGEG